jgi:copper chaperone CopZ
MNAHTVTVSFDDEKVGLDEINAALNDAGYVVKGSEKVE